MNKKIVFFLNNFAVGGTERLLLALLLELRKNYDITIVTVLGSGPLEESFAQNNLTIFHAEPFDLQRKHFPFKLFWLIIAPITFLRILFFLRKVKPRIVVTSLYQADFLGIVAAWCLGVKKRIIIQHDVKELDFLGSFLKSVLPIRLATGVVAVSRTVSDFLISYFNVPTEKVTIIPNGVDFKKFKNILPEDERRNLVIGMIGRLEPAKDPFSFFRALRTLKEKFNLEPEVIIAGSGSLEIPLQDYARAHDLKKIKFLGIVLEPVKFFRQIDILVVPSPEEGFGLVVLEGLAAQKIIFASNIPAFGEILKKDNSGALFRPGDSAELADILAKAISNSETITKHKSHLARWFQEYAEFYDMKNVVRRYENLFK